MRRLRNKIKRTFNRLLMMTAAVIPTAVVYFLTQIPSEIASWIPAGLTAIVVLWIITSFLNPSNKHINSGGYVVLTKENELEHRYIAKQLMGRKLGYNEVVHHINGKKQDNRIVNLCLMEREQHRSFHAWLKVEKRKSGRYPSNKEQKNLLTRKYGGTLLEKLSA